AANTQADSTATTPPSQHRLERRKPPNSIIINQEADLEGLDEAHVGAQHLADGLRPPQFENPKRGQYIVDVQQIGPKVVEHRFVLRPRPSDDVGQRLRDIASAQRILEGCPSCLK